MWTSVVEAVAAGSASAIGVGALGRRWFRAAVRDVVDEYAAEIRRGQVDFERRQAAHLDRQDARLERIERRVDQIGSRRR